MELKLSVADPGCLSRIQGVKQAPYPGSATLLKLKGGETHTFNLLRDGLLLQLQFSLELLYLLAGGLLGPVLKAGGGLVPAPPPRHHARLRVSLQAHAQHLNLLVNLPVQQIQIIFYVPEAYIMY
jgi:hypothetical protein